MFCLACHVTRAIALYYFGSYKYITVVLENIMHSQNASAVIRSCDGFGIQNAHIIENEYRYNINPLVLKGANQWVSIHKYNQQKNNTCKKNPKSEFQKRSQIAM